tara:strand:+ start:32 stop:1039 length:1008 start_codon:yes stop_codon:yes gene_type:complete
MVEGGIVALGVVDCLGRKERRARMERYSILLGDCKKTLTTLPSKSVHCCITSPPYFGLRDYGMDEQIGLEETPNEFIKSLVDVFREVKRVLRNDGTLWINIGDSYCAGSRNTSTIQTMSEKHRGEPLTRRNKATGDIKNKDLIGIPWMLAFALRADGWYLRQDIIWSKPNCMPESVKDRCTKSHEYVFLLSKSPQYFYDHAAIKEKSDLKLVGKKQKISYHDEGSLRNDGDRVVERSAYRNKRSVWRVSPKPYSEAHFAVFPPELIEPCILAGCPRDGTVLDPFGGSGTTAGVAIKNGRNAILCELNEEYADLIPQRIKQITNGFVAGQMTLGDY